MVYDTSNGPENDIGNYLGPCSTSESETGVGEDLQFSIEYICCIGIESYQDKESGRSQAL